MDLSPSVYEPFVFSPQGQRQTPPTERAQRWVEPHLAAAEQLEAENRSEEAAEARAEALQRMHEFYVHARVTRQPPPQSVNKLSAVVTPTSNCGACLPFSDLSNSNLSSPSYTPFKPTPFSPADLSFSDLSDSSLSSPSYTPFKPTPFSPAGMDSWGCAEGSPAQQQHDLLASAAAANAALAHDLLSPCALEQLRTVPEHRLSPDDEEDEGEEDGSAPSDLQAVLISDASIVRHMHGRPFTLYRLFAPGAFGEHVAFRRYSDFVALDERLRFYLRNRLRPIGLQLLPCVAERSWPRLPPKTLFWQDATAAALTTRRWGGLQLYLDAVLEVITVGENDGAWRAFKEFLGLA